MTTHEPCKIHETKAEHRDEGVPFCRDCELDCLRDLLREVANCYDEWDDGAEYHVVKIPNKLWDTILPLRTPAVVEVKP